MIYSAESLILDVFSRGSVVFRSRYSERAKQQQLQQQQLYFCFRRFPFSTKPTHGVGSPRGSGVALWQKMCIQGQRQSRVLSGVITAACLLWGQDEWSCAQCTHPRLHHHHIKAFSISVHLCLSMHISLTAPFCLYSLFRKCTWDSDRFSILFLHHFFSGENIVVIDATGTVACEMSSWLQEPCLNRTCSWQSLRLLPQKELKTDQLVKQKGHFYSLVDFGLIGFAKFHYFFSLVWGRKCLSFRNSQSRIT